MSDRVLILARASGPRRKRGLTLLECMIATVLLAVGAGDVMAAVSASYQQQRYADEQVAACEVAHQLMETVCARPYMLANEGDLMAQDFDGYSDAVDAGGESLPAGWTGPAYTRLVSVDPIPGSSMGRVDIAVTVPSGGTIQLSRLLRADP